MKSPPTLSEKKPADEGLRCPECEYNLTGLDRDVCPECGGAFDRERLLAELAGAPAPIPIWSRRSEIGGPKAFALTLVEIWFHPTRYAERFPTNPNEQEPILFSRYCLLVAILASAIPTAIASSGFVTNMIFVALHLTIGISICERLIAATVFMPLRIAEWVEAWYQRNLAFVRMTRAFLVLNVTCVSIGIIGECILFGTPGYEFSAFVGMLISCYWWLVIVYTAVTYRRNVLTFIIAVWGVPLFSLLSFAVATMATGPIVQLLDALLP